MLSINWPELLKDLVLTGLAAFGGAWAAFFFESRREAKRERDEQYRAIRFAHFVVMSQLTELLSLQEQHLQKADRENAWWQLKPLLQGFAAPVLNLSALAFTFEGSDPDLLNRLTVGQQRFETVRHVIAFRNEAYVELQRRAVVLQSQGLDPEPGGAEFQQAIGRELVRRLKDVTTALLDEHQSARSLLQSNLDSITGAVAEHFPKKRLPKYTLIPKEQRV